MNGILALVVCVMAGIVGGIGYGCYSFGGIVKPKPVEREIPLGEADDAPTTTMVMWVPGVIGHMAFGAITAVLVFGVYIAPKTLVGQHATVSLTWYNVAMVLLAGLGGSTVVGELIDAKQWKRLAPVLAKAKVDPATAPSAPRAAQMLDLVGKPVEK